MFQVLKARCVTLAGISWDVTEQRTDARMFLVKDTKDGLKKNVVSIADTKNSIGKKKKQVGAKIHLQNNDVVFFFKLL